MSTIPDSKPPVRRNGPDPKPLDPWAASRIGAKPEPEPTLSPTPWDALDAAEACCRMLDEHFDYWGAPYSIERDQRYRDLREIVINAVMRVPCFKGTEPPIDALPPTLAHISRGQSWWVSVGRHALIRFEGDLLTALKAADVPRRYALRPVEFEFWRRRGMREDDPDQDPETTATVQTGADRGCPSDNLFPDRNAPLPVAPEPASPTLAMNLNPSGEPDSPPSEGSPSRPKSQTAATMRLARNRQIARQLAARGMPNTRIAEKLGCSVRTIYNYLSYLSDSDT